MCLFTDAMGRLPSIPDKSMFRAVEQTFKDYHVHNKEFRLSASNAKTEHAILDWKEMQRLLRIGLGLPESTSSPSDEAESSNRREDHNFERLKAHIMPLSKAPTFEQARNEWKVIGVHIEKEWDACPCGQPIKELCFLENKVTKQRTYVGNICVNRFMGIETGSLLDGMKKIMKDPSANANTDVIEYAKSNGYLFEQEYEFLMETRRKRKLSAKQEQWKIRINQRILQQSIVSKRKVVHSSGNAIKN